jgi:DNA-binding transcriptional ArsR family regulator
VIRIHFTAADLARVRFAPRPAPIQELNAALSMMCSPAETLLYGRWRQRLLRSLPKAVQPLRDLVPGSEAPGFIDVLSDTLRDGLETERGTDREMVRTEIERVYATAKGTYSPPPWIRDLHRGDADAWRVLMRAQYAAFDTALGPVWPIVQDLHQAEFTRYAVAVAERGLGAALTDAIPGSRLGDDVWEFAAPRGQEIKLRGQGMVLLPTFHWTGHPLIACAPDSPLIITYPAGPGLPLSPDTVQGSPDALAGVLGRTRADLLLMLDREHTTGDLARRLGVGSATVSEHTAALRGAGLITTVRAGRAVLHRRTALGSLLVRRHSADRTSM